MRRNASTVVVLPGSPNPAPAEVLAAIDRSMNVALIRPRKPAAAEVGDPEPDFYLGPLRSARPHRVAFVPATEPAQQAVGVLQALGSLRHGPWWPGLDQVLETARTFYPGRLAEGAAAVG